MATPAMSKILSSIIYNPFFKRGAFYPYPKGNDQGHVPIWFVEALDLVQLYNDPILLPGSRRVVLGFFVGTKETHQTRRGRS